MVYLAEPYLERLDGEESRLYKRKAPRWISLFSENSWMY